MNDPQIWTLLGVFSAIMFAVFGFFTRNIASKFESLEEKVVVGNQLLTATINGVEQRLDLKIDGLEQRLGDRIDALDTQVDDKYDHDLPLVKSRGVLHAQRFTSDHPDLALP